MTDKTETPLKIPTNPPISASIVDMEYAGISFMLVCCILLYFIEKPLPFHAILLVPVPRELNI